MPCDNTAILEIIKKSKEDNYMYNLVGQPILRPKVYTYKTVKLSIN